MKIHFIYSGIFKCKHFCAHFSHYKWCSVIHFLKYGQSAHQPCSHPAEPPPSCASGCWHTRSVSPMLHKCLCVFLAFSLHTPVTVGWGKYGQRMKWQKFCSMPYCFVNLVNISPENTSRVGIGLECFCLAENDHYDEHYRYMCCAHCIFNFFFTSGVSLKQFWFHYLV